MRPLRLFVPRGILHPTNFEMRTFVFQTLFVARLSEEERRRRPIALSTMPIKNVLKNEQQGDVRSPRSLRSLANPCNQQTFEKRK